MRSGDTAGDASGAQERHVIDGLLGRRDISIAVVPRKPSSSERRGPGQLVRGQSPSSFTRSGPSRAGTPSRMAAVMIDEIRLRGHARPLDSDGQ
jgi:hypothetical protein